MTDERLPPPDAADGGAPQGSPSAEADEEQGPVDAGTEGAARETFERLEDSVAAGFERVLAVFENKLAYDGFKERQIDTLHAELQGYRDDLVAKAARPLVQGMLRLHDDVGRVLSSLRKKDPAELTAERFFRAIEGFREDLEIVLDHHGVEAYSEPGDAYVPQRQRTLETVATSDPERAGQVAHRLRPGFEHGGEILRKEQVAVYVAAAGTAAEPPPVEETGDLKSEGAVGEPRQEGHNTAGGTHG